MRKITSWAILLAFLVSCIMPPSGFAQMIEGVGLMPEPGTIVRTSPAFVPAHLMGVMIDARDPLKFDFLIRKGEGTVTADEKNVEYRKLIKYFLAAMTIPDSDQWVNLSPYENDRIIQENFGMTEMGRDLLAQDYLLKQLTASLIHPDTDLGKTFWKRVYKRAQTEFGTTDIPLNAFNKVWITPDKATVWEKGNTAYVIESHLKVLTEQDYVSLQKNSNSSVFGTDQASSQEVNEVARLSGDIVRDVLIPEIEKEVNEGKNFAPLRQIFASMILATWYKKALKESLLGEVYADRAKVKGVDQDPRNNTMIYDQYLAAFKKGVVNLIKEDMDEYSQEIIPRKYFSGGYDPEGMKKAFKRDSSPVPPPAARRLLDDAQGSNVDLAQVALNAAPSGTAAQKAPAQLSLPVQKTFTAIHNQDEKLLNTGVKRLSEIIVQAQASPEELAALVREGDAVARNPNNNDTKIHAYPLGIRYEWSTRDLYYQFTGFVDGIVAGRISLDAVNAYVKTLDSAQSLVESLMIQGGRMLANLKTKGGEKYTNPALPYDDRTAYELLRLTFEHMVNMVRASEGTVKDQQRQMAQATHGLYAQIAPLIPNYVPVKFSDISDFAQADSAQGKLKEVDYQPGNITPAQQTASIVSGLAELFNINKVPNASVSELQRRLALERPNLEATLQTQYWIKDASGQKTVRGTALLEITRAVVNNIGPLTEIANRAGVVSEEARRSVDSYLKDVVDVYAERDKKTIYDLVLASLKNPDQGADSAQKDFTRGGIDLNAANLNMQIKRDGNGVMLPMSQQNLENIRIDGLIPEILSIVPATTLPMLSEAAGSSGSSV